MKLYNISLFLIIILNIKSENDSYSINISTILSTNPIYYSTNEIYSSTKISFTSSNIISSLNNNSNTFQFTSTPQINSTFINNNNINLGQTPIITNSNIETTNPKINSSFPINNKTFSSFIVTNTIIESTMYKTNNNYNLFFLQVQVVDYLLKIYMLYEAKFPNTLKIKIYIDTSFRNLQIIREKLSVIGNYTRNKNNIVEYIANLTDYINIQNLNVTIEKIEIVEEENDINNRYDIYFLVDDGNLNTIKTKNLINNGSFDFSNVFDRTYYNHYLYDIQNISEGCNFYINLYKNETYYNGKKTIFLNFYDYFNDSAIIKANCILSSEYTDKIPCTLNNQTNGNYIIKSSVYPFDDEIFIFKKEKDQVFHLSCSPKNNKSNSTKIIIIIIFLSIIIVICFIVLLIIVCCKHKNHLSSVLNKSTSSQNSGNKETGVNSSMDLN